MGYKTYIAPPYSGYEALYFDALKDSPDSAIMPGTPGYKEVVITAGGTREPIDDVRYVGNFSGGRLGLALAAEYASHGHEVTLYAPDETVSRHGLPERVEHIPFTNAESLRTKMLGIGIADLVLHAAAVADYTPVKQQGKISSDQERLSITMERTPKILSELRKHFGKNTTIAGFKLLSGVSVDQLVDTARGQIRANQTNYSVANLLDDLQPDGERVVHLVNTDGYVNPLTGSSQDVAKSIYRAIKWDSRNAARRG